jgi:carboxypeptidase D
MVAPEVSFRALEVLLGRVDGFEGPKPFTVDVGFAAGGNGTGATGDTNENAGQTGSASAVDGAAASGEALRKTSGAWNLDVRRAGLLAGWLVCLGFLAL